MNRRDGGAAAAVIVVMVLVFAIRAAIARIIGDKVSKRVANAIVLTVLVLLIASVIGGVLLIEATGMH
jgi:hypothetical protein